MTVENQATRNGAYKASPIDNTPFGDSQELPINFRMNTASMAGGLSLMLSHAHTIGLRYTAAVRMRADLSTPRFQTLMPAHEGRDHFPSREAWRKIRTRAEQAANGSLCPKRMRRSWSPAGGRAGHGSTGASGPRRHSRC